MILHVSIAKIGGIADIAVSQLYRVSTVRANIVVLAEPKHVRFTFLFHIRVPMKALALSSLWVVKMANDSAIRIFMQEVWNQRSSADLRDLDH